MLVFAPLVHALLVHALLVHAPLVDALLGHALLTGAALFLRRLATSGWQPMTRNLRLTDLEAALLSWRDLRLNRLVILLHAWIGMLGILRLGGIVGMDGRRHLRVRPPRWKT